MLRFRDGVPVACITVGTFGGSSLGADWKWIGGVVGVETVVVGGQGKQKRRIRFLVSTRRSIGTPDMRWGFSMPNQS